MVMVMVMAMVMVMVMVMVKTCSDVDTLGSQHHSATLNSEDCAKGSCPELIPPDHLLGWPFPLVHAAGAGEVQEALYDLGIDLLVHLLDESNVAHIDQVLATAEARPCRRTLDRIVSKVDHLEDAVGCMMLARMHWHHHNPSIGCGLNLPSARL